MSKIYFTGFASAISDKSVHDYDLIIQDLLNHLYTRKGERLMSPNFGSIVWDLIFELQSPSVATEIRDDLTRIIESDPRLTLQSIQVIPDTYSYKAEIILFVKPLNTVRRLDIDFNNRINKISNVE